MYGWSNGLGLRADGRKPQVAEMIPGRWSAVFVAQQEVGDVKDTALAAELLARVSRRPRSEERMVQLKVLCWAVR
jgi:hypothetical protein